MNYGFPFITNISDVLPAIEGRDEFVVAEKEDYTVINYNVMMADTFPDVYSDTGVVGCIFKNGQWYNEAAAIRRECRGIIFDSKTGDIVRRPFHKFFNVNEREETQDHVVDLLRPHCILEKLDGSMIAPFIVDGKMIWGTKMGATDVAKPVEEFVKNNPQYIEFANLWIKRGCTPIFEWCSRKQRIVLDYKEDQLILTAIRNMHTGQYMTDDVMMKFGGLLSYGITDIPVVRQFEPQTDMKAFLEYVHDLEDLEGFVVRFDDGHMLKLKCHWYLQIHKAKEAILQDRNIVELILEEHLDDIKAHLPAEDRDRLTLFESNFNAMLALGAASISSTMFLIRNSNTERKDFALNHANYYDQFTRAVSFRIWDDYSNENTLRVMREMVRNNLTKTVKYEAIRDAWFPGAKYND